MNTEKYGGTTLPPFVNATDHPVAVEDTTNMQQESLVPYPIINTEDTKSPYVTPGKDTMEETPVLTFGQKAAGVSFNPSKDPIVDRIKQMYAEIIDELNDQRGKAEAGEAKRYFSTAITNAEISQMLAIKAVTWQW